MHARPATRGYTWYQDRALKDGYDFPQWQIAGKPVGSGDGFGETGADPFHALENVENDTNGNTGSR